MTHPTRVVQTTYRYPWSFPTGRPGPVAAVVVEDGSGHASGQAVWLAEEALRGDAAAVHAEVQEGLGRYLGSWVTEFCATPAPGGHLQRRPTSP